MVSKWSSYLFLLLTTIAIGNAASVKEDAKDIRRVDSPSPSSEDKDSRTLIVTTTGHGAAGAIGATTNAAANAISTLFSSHNVSLILGAIGVVLLLGALAIALYYLFFAATAVGTALFKEEGYPGGYYNYGQYRSLDDSDSYFNLKILDWIAMMEEIYRKFDLKRMDCQKRLVCELHQNQDELGPTARKMARAMSYLEYLDGVSMPDPIRQLVTEYNDAARKGRNMQKDCGEMYTTCQFSVKELFRKYNKQTNNHLRK